MDENDRQGVKGVAKIGTKDGKSPFLIIELDQEKEKLEHKG